MRALLPVIFVLAPSWTYANFDSAKKLHDAAEYTKAYKQFIPLAQNRDKRAQYYIGRMFHLGEGVVQDKFEAVRWYKLSAAQGFARAQNNLGVLYLERDNIDEAIQLFAAAADQGLSQAKPNLQIARDIKKKKKHSSVDAHGQPQSTGMELHFNRMRESLK